ncbi:MAG: hypothetical protein IJ891_03480 [Prevotella sp.]|nr:hypothetical protein [Prevotella sp.]
MSLVAPSGRLEKQPAQQHAKQGRDREAAGTAACPQKGGGSSAQHWHFPSKRGRKNKNIVSKQEKMFHHSKASNDWLPDGALRQSRWRLYQFVVNAHSNCKNVTYRKQNGTKRKAA